MVALLFLSLHDALPVSEIRLLLVRVPPLTLAPPLSCPALTVAPAVLVSLHETVPPALLLNVEAFATVPVMVALLLTVPPEIPTAPEIRLLLVRVPPLTLAPPLSCPSLTVVPAVFVS